MRHDYFARYTGFSLIELMIVIVIIGILAMLAIPSYQHYTAKARFAEVMAATAPFKTAVSLALQQNTPAEELKNGLHGIPSSPTPSQNVASIIVDQGTITATATDRLKKVTYVLTANSEGSQWTISGTCLAAGLCND